MDKKIRIFIDEELYPMIVTPIEKYIKPNMTVQEKIIAKQDVFLQIKELVNYNVLKNIVDNTPEEELVKAITEFKEQFIHE